MDMRRVVIGIRIKAQERLMSEEERHSPRFAALLFRPKVHPEAIRPGRERHRPMPHKALAIRNNW